MPVRLLRMLPASLAVSPRAKRGEGAKSRAVKVPDFRNACLFHISRCRAIAVHSTYGLGITAKSSNDEAMGK